jgi:hypothetical protein
VRAVAEVMTSRTFCLGLPLELSRGRLLNQNRCPPVRHVTADHCRADRATSQAWLNDRRDVPQAASVKAGRGGVWHARAIIKRVSDRPRLHVAKRLRT